MVEARTNRRASEAGYAVIPEGEQQEPLRVFRLVQGAIRAGVFAPAVSAGTTLRRSELFRVMQHLQDEDPMRWQARPPQRKVRDDASLRLTHRDVDLLLKASALSTTSWRARVILLLLYTTGIRAGALARMRLSNVWGHGRGCTRAVSSMRG